MNVVDLHPEDLLDKDAAGDLDATERDRLDAHLARCVACRLERQLRLDFSEELAADSPLRSFGLIAEEDAVREVARVSRTALRDAGDAVAPSTRRPSMWARRRTAKTAWLFAAAALLVGGVAAATGLTDGEWRHLMGGESSPPVSVPTEVRPVEPARTAIHHSTTPPTPLPPLPVPSVAESDPSDPIVAAPVSPAPLAPTPARPPPTSVASAPLPIGPAELLDGESRARRDGEYGRALEIHRDLETRYPTSREAQVSRAVAGRLLLDRGDPAGALAAFDSYLAAGSGDLREEVMVGRATALDRLGRSDEAARAWSDLLTAFPETPYAQHARARCESLNGALNGH